MFGFVVVSLEEEGPPPFANFLKGKQIAAVSHMGPREEAQNQREAPTATESRARRRPIADDVRLDKKITNKKISGGGNLIPVVPDLGQYELSFVHTGQSNYMRQYRIFATNSDNVFRQDYSSEVFFKSPPDAAGNICSPIATCFQSASFISALEELALQAEVVRARQMLVTQPAQRATTNQNLDPANLFFDSESRAVQASASADEDTAQAQSLAVTARLMAMINRMQTTDSNGRERAGAINGATAHVPPAQAPALFTCPGETALQTIQPMHTQLTVDAPTDRQQIVPGVRPPEARGDLVDLMRCMNDHSALLNSNNNNNTHQLAIPFHTYSFGNHGRSCEHHLRRCVSAIMAFATSASSVAHWISAMDASLQRCCSMAMRVSASAV